MAELADDQKVLGSIPATNHNIYSGEPEIVQCPGTFEKELNVGENSFG